MHCMFSNNFTSNVLTIRKVNSTTGVGVAGAVFELVACCGRAVTAVTNAAGIAAFTVCPCNVYTVREITAPAGFIPNDTIFCVQVDGCGCITVNGVATNQITVENTPITSSFSAIKINTVTGAPLAGATYTLSQNGTTISSTVSTAAGVVAFSGLAPGTYQLVETTPPAGFQTNDYIYTVIVAQDGTVTIDGQTADGFLLNDVPLGEVSFSKINEAGAVVSGAVFQLTQGTTVVGTATSTATGLVNFGVLTPGTYTLTETAAAPGYDLITTSYTVVVSSNGTITVNGTAIDAFSIVNVATAVSAAPAINTVTVGDATVTGTGVAGAEVTVTFANGSTASTTVSTLGTWSVGLPSGVTLVAGQTVSAIQTETGKLPSSAVSTTIL